jgi:GT2 family glycosyltransferase
MRQITVGVASYKSAEKLRRTIASIQEQTRSSFRLIVVHNPSEGDDDTRAVIEAAAALYRNVEPVWMPENVGYAGAVNELLRRADSEYLFYADNDIVIHTPGWDEEMALCLDRFHEVGMVFPNGGPCAIDRGQYQEVLWGVGFCWALNRVCMSDVGLFDAEIGHQNECDYCLRVRMAGYRCAALPSVRVHHDATATNNPASIERINRGVIQFVDKWNRYFNGKNYHYHHPNVTRWADWPPNALYLEEYFKTRIGEINTNPEVVTIDGALHDLIKVPRPSGFYRNRII